MARRVRQAWRALDRGDHEAVLATFAPRFEYRFVGEHALGGTRRTLSTQRAWFERLARVLPDLRFEVLDVVVSGGPWRTRAVVLVSVRGTSGGYANVLMQHLELRWGKVTRVLTLEDTQTLAQALGRRAAAGHAEASAPPLSDPSA